MLDYWTLNMITIKNKYPILHFNGLFDQLGDTRHFTKLDLSSRYYEVRKAKGDEPRMACVSHFGSYEFLLVPFGLTNAVANFCNLINKVLAHLLV